MKTKLRPFTVRHADGTSETVRGLCERDEECKSWLVAPEGHAAIEKARHDWIVKNPQHGPCRCGVCRKGETRL
jgi:hypothetical protein